MTRSAILNLLRVLFCIIAIPEVMGTAAAAEPSPEALRHFENKVRPLLLNRCVKCHGPEKQKAKLRLDSAAALARGGESGPTVRPGDPDRSLLIQAVRRTG